MMENDAYPALFRQADRASRTHQQTYLTLVWGEFALLIFASIVSTAYFTAVPAWSGAVNLVSILIFVASLVILIYRSQRKPEQDWYRTRALAESIKTLTWRYMMRAHPFHDGVTETGHRNEFRENIMRVFHSQIQPAVALADEPSADGSQITREMERVRALPLQERGDYYRVARIEDQQSWYRKKASFNRRRARRWFIGAVLAYSVAVCLVVARGAFQSPALPVDPIIVIASSILGWVQIKKFNELATAYAVTAHEIGMVKLTDHAFVNDQEFAQFVNEAELAFSREHTSWIARNAN